MQLVTLLAMTLQAMQLVWGRGKALMARKKEPPLVPDPAHHHDNDNDDDVDADYDDDDDVVVNGRANSTLYGIPGEVL